MPKPITIMLLGEPTAWRHRTSANGRHRYLPEKQRAVSDTLRTAAQRAMLEHSGGQSYAVPFMTPVRLELLAELPIPLTWSQRKRSAALRGEILPGKRPDLSNTLKLCEDACNGVVYRDDSLVCELHCRKRYSEQPKIVITVVPFE